jgi:hypothetical protein
MSKKIVIVMLGWMMFCSGLLIFQACSVDCDPKREEYKLLGLFSTAKRITGTKSYSGSATLTDYVVRNLDTFEKVRYDSVGLEIRHDLGRIAMNRTGDFGVAIACDPIVIYESLSDLIVTSNQNYTASHPAGTNLKDLITIHPNYTTIAYESELFINEGQIGPVNILLKFKSPPAENALHTFIITYSVEGGGQVSTTLRDVMVTK